MLASILAATASAVLLMSQPALQHHTTVVKHHTVAKHATVKATPKATKAPAKAKKVKHSHLQKMGRYSSFRSSSFGGGYRSYRSYGSYRSVYRSPSTYRTVYRPTTYNYNRNYTRYSRPYNAGAYRRTTYYRNTAIVHHYYHAPYIYHGGYGGGGSGMGDLLVSMMVMNAITHQMQPQYVYVQPGQQVPTYAQPVQGNQLPQGAAAQCQDQYGNLVSCDPSAGIPPTSPNGTAIATPNPTPTPQVVTRTPFHTKFLAFIGTLAILGLVAVGIIAFLKSRSVAA